MVNKQHGSFIDRTGEKHITNEGHGIEILKYHSSVHCNVIFKDGTVIEGVEYSRVKRGTVKKPAYIIGEKVLTREGCFAELINYIDCTHCTIRFDSGNIKEGVSYKCFKNGSVKNPYHPSVCGVGFIGEGDIKVKENGKHTKQYSLWSHMLLRCYGNRVYKSYKDVTVCEEWHNFQNFGDWVNKNYNTETMLGWELDKDILVKGNKVYSPETCCFVPLEINKIFKTTVIGKYSVGVVKNYNKFNVYIHKYNKRYFLKGYDTLEEAKTAQKIAKENYIKEVAEKWKGLISNKAYEALINYQVEITD